MRIFYNAKVYTADEKKPLASAFVTDGGRFIYVGTDAQALKYGSGIDMCGQCVIPGMVESHAHLVSNSFLGDMNMFFLEPDITAKELPDALRSIANDEKYRDEPILRGMGIDLACDSFCSADIDSAIPDKPVFIFTNDGHALLMNTKALKMANIDKNTADPSDASYFERDGDGNPSGMAIEILAMLLCRESLESGVEVNPQKAFAEIQRGYLRLGFTAAFDAATLHGGKSRELDMLSDMAREDCLKMHIFTSYVYYGESIDTLSDSIKNMKEQREKYNSEFIHPTTLKMIADGTIEASTALLFEPYEQSKDTGSSLLGLSEMRRASKAAAEADFNIHIHAIGDRAVSEALCALKDVGETAVTKTITHNQLYTKDALCALIGEKNIFFQTTPYWLKNDDYTEKTIGSARAERQFPIGSAARGGVKVTFGSDSLDGEICQNPFVGMFFAVIRGSGTALCRPPKSEGITLRQALEAYTINGAAQLGAEKEIGSISVGKYADFAVLNQDIFAVSTANLLKTTVTKTYFCGEMVYCRKKGEDEVFIDEECQDEVTAIIKELRKEGLA